MSIKDWNAAERPREKLLSVGAHALSDAELLAIFIRTGVAGYSAVDIARQLLSRHGGLRPLLNLEASEFCAERGLGPAKYAQLHAALELSRRHLRAALDRGDPLSNPSDTRAFLRARLRDYPHEVFACLFLDNRHRVIHYEELFRGTIDGASVHPREVVKAALRCNAAALIFAHNHPSGIAEPSQADRSLTHRLKTALSLVDIRVLDHFVVGDTDIISLAEQGVI